MQPGAVTDRFGRSRISWVALSSFTSVLPVWRGLYTFEAARQTSPLKCITTTAHPQKWNNRNLHVEEGCSS
jgi:hypothetical protein